MSRQSGASGMTEKKKPGKITARVIDEETGLRIIEKVRAIRIQSREYVLLVMEDYSPTLGEINGKVSFVTDTEELVYERIQGFFRLSNNEFTLTIKEKN